MVAMKLTTKQCLDMYNSIREIAENSKDEKFREKVGKNASKVFFRFSMISKKLKDVVESAGEAEQDLLSSIAQPIFVESDTFDENGNRTKVFSGRYNFKQLEDKKRFDEEKKKLFSEEVSLLDMYVFKLSEIHPLLSINDYLALEPIYDNDMAEFVGKEEKESSK
ncbi:MAG: hypothetical protein ACM34K_01320 [Bacillota bacterium]